MHTRTHNHIKPMTTTGEENDDHECVMLDQSFWRSILCLFLIFGLLLALSMAVSEEGGDEHEIRERFRWSSPDVSLSMVILPWSRGIPSIMAYLSQPTSLAPSRPPPGHSSRGSDSGRSPLTSLVLSERGGRGDDAGLDYWSGSRSNLTPVDLSPTTMIRLDFVHSPFPSTFVSGGSSDLSDLLITLSKLLNCSSTPYHLSSTPRFLLASPPYLVSWSNPNRLTNDFLSQKKEEEEEGEGVSELSLTGRTTTCNISSWTLLRMSIH